MTAALRNCLALFFICLLCVAMRSPSQSLKGLDVWESSNPEYSLVSQVVIDKNENKLLAVEPCEYEDCNWGWTDLTPITGGYLARYQNVGITYELYVREINPNEIQLFITSATPKDTRVLLALDHLHRK